MIECLSRIRFGIVGELSWNQLINLAHKHELFKLHTN